MCLKPTPSKYNNLLHILKRIQITLNIQYRLLYWTLQYSIIPEYLTSVKRNLLLAEI